MNWLFSSGGQSIGASAPILPVNIQYWFPLGFTSLILLSKRLSRVFSSTTVQKCRFFGARWGYKNFCISRVTETLLYLVTAAQVLNWTTSALLASAVWAVRTTPGRESDLQKCLKWDQITEKAMAPNSSTLAWKIPRTEEPAGLQSKGSLRVGHDPVTSYFHFPLSCIGEGNGNPLQCSCLENPRDGGAWWAAVYGVAQSRTRRKQLSSSSSKIRALQYTKQILTAIKGEFNSNTTKVRDF